MSSSEQILANAIVVTADEAFPGSIQVRDGRIAAIGRGAGVPAGAVDLEGDYLLPGLVELHTDNLERHVSPRPGVVWPLLSAIGAHDTELAAAGITTVLDAVRLGRLRGGSAYMQMVPEIVATLRAARGSDMLRAEHFLHFRCEVSSDGVVDDLEVLLDPEDVRLVSVMDHTPGQRQFADIAKYREYHMGRYGLNEAEMQAFMEKSRVMQEKNSAPNRRAIVAMARARGLVLASHDDATPAHVEEARADGVAVAEFPTTVEAAELAVRHDMRVLMGAPNVVRGGSHSGNVSARALAERGHLDILSSDYVPVSLLRSAFILADEVADIDLPAAVAAVSRAPARAVGLEDRGEIAEAQRADLIRVRRHDGVEMVRNAWREGRRIL